MQMRLLIPPMILAIGLLLPLASYAQGTLYVSNLEQAPISTRAVASDSWVAQEFRVGTNPEGYTINSVE